MNSAYNSAAIRRLLLAAFSDDEFTFFCYDHFPEVYQKFATGMSFPAKVQTLIDHCARYNTFTELLPLVEEANPAKYAEFTPFLQKPEPKSPTLAPQPPTPSPRPLTPARQPFEPEMILIPAGEFLMGSDPRVDPNAEELEQPQHLFYLPDYYIAKTPVTNAQYAAFVQATHHHPPLYWTDESPPQGKEEHPVVLVTWRNVMTYCRWLAGVTNHPYTLPSESEWEKAARGTDGRIYPWGNKWDVGRCNSWESEIGITMPVESHSNGASPYGLLNMAGNIWELTRSSFDYYPYDPANSREDIEDIYANVDHTVRGGAFDSSKFSVRCAIRFPVTIILTPVVSSI